MNLGQFEELDAAMASKKRGRELAQAEQEMREAQEIEDKVILFSSALQTFGLVFDL